MAPIVIIAFGTGFLMELATLYYKIARNEDVTGNPLFTMGIILFLIGLQFFIYGFLGELIIRSYYESGKKKTYMVRKIG
jgi:hypothetical protein